MPLHAGATGAARRRLAPLAIAFVLALLSVAIPFARVAACSCAMLGTMEERVALSTAAFVGTVVESEPAAAGQLGPATLYRFEVEGSAKGVEASPVVVRAEDGGASCGMTFEIGRRYVIFAYGQPDLLETGLCSGNEELAPDAEPPLAIEAVAAAEPTPTGTPAPDRAPVPQIVGEGAAELPLPLILFAAGGLAFAALAAFALRRPGPG